MSQEFYTAAAVPIVSLFMAAAFGVAWLVWWIKYGRKGLL